MSERKLVTIRTIDDVTPIEGADKIETYHIGGWTIVDQKGLYKKGDKVLYFEIDSMIPLNNPHFTFLEKFGRQMYDGKLYHRLKTIKLKGQISQGLIASLDVLDGKEIKEDFDYSDDLGIVKYEPPIPAQLVGKQSNWPSFIEKTDEIRLQTLASDYKKFVSEIIKDKENWIPYQKIDGSSITIFCEPNQKPRICSRNWELLEDSTTYWQVAKQLSLQLPNEESYVPLFDYLSLCAKEAKKTIILQGELFGEGIQQNRLGIKGQSIRFFTIQEYDEEDMSTKRLSPEEIQQSLFYRSVYEQLWVPKLDVKLPSTLEEMIKQPDGITNKVECGNNSQIEGIVWRHKSQSYIKVPKDKKIDISKVPEDKREYVLEKMGDPSFDIIKASFKCISNNYLLRNE